MREPISALFDLESREVLWVDLKSFGDLTENQVESSWRGVEALLKAVVKSVPWRLHLQELARLHGECRGAEFVDERDSADIVFALKDGDYSPQNRSKILSELL